MGLAMESVEVGTSCTAQSLMQATHSILARFQLDSVHAAHKSRVVATSRAGLGEFQLCPQSPGPGRSTSCAFQTRVRLTSFQTIKTLCTCTISFKACASLHPMHAHCKSSQFKPNQPLLLQARSAAARTQCAVWSLAVAAHGCACCNGCPCCQFGRY